MRTSFRRTFAATLSLLAITAVSPHKSYADEANLALGKLIFIERAEPQCALCHTLADAEAEGEVGPNLDELLPDADRVKTALINGIGPMAPYETLTAEEIEAVALYVSTVAGFNQTPCQHSLRR